MKQANPMAEDMFEKAREAFFGIVKKSPEPSAVSTDIPINPRNETPTEEDNGPSSDKP